MGKQLWDAIFLFLYRNEMGIIRGHVQKPDQMMWDLGYMAAALIFPT